jgi:3-hydroxyacyl-[acyl-carrier-protein] dehydratase
MSIELILKNLPQRYPFLMCDFIEDYEYKKFSKGYKNVSINEWYFEGHFPDDPIMPGVLILEAMTQVGGFVFLEKNDGSDLPLKGYIAGFDKVKFLKKVIPGDRLDIDAEFISQFGNLGKAKAIASVNGKQVAVAEIMYKFEEKNVVV